MTTRMPVRTGRSCRPCPRPSRRHPHAMEHLFGMAGSLPYNYFDLGSCKRGDIWRVELSRGANVFMVDSSGLSAFKQGRNFTHYGGGGLITQSPHDFVVPRSGRWYI